YFDETSPLAPLQGASLDGTNTPGLKPWAESSCPFGASLACISHKAGNLPLGLFCSFFKSNWLPSRFLSGSIESLKSKAHLITDARKSKNLTHLQRVLLFKDSSVLQI